MDAGFYQIFKDYTERRLRDPSYVESIKTRDNGTWVHPKSDYVSAIGCFDTVGSLGIPSLGILKWRDINKRFEFHDTDLAHANVGHAFHALALDENRGPFTPTLWELPPPPDISTFEDGKKPTVLRQCWFPGVHANIGGGYDDQEIADVTLAWMVEMLSEVAGCVEFDDCYLAYIIKNDDNHRNSQWAEGKIYNSATGVFRFVGGKYRTPGEYATEHGGDTYETMHPCVRARYELLTKGKSKPEWDCKALKGWEYCVDESVMDRVAYKWVKKDKTGKEVRVLKEEPLGNYQKWLAGKEIIVKYLGEVAWEGVPEMDVEEVAARLGKESPRPTQAAYVANSGCQTCESPARFRGGKGSGVANNNDMKIEPAGAVNVLSPQDAGHYKDKGPNDLPSTSTATNQSQQNAPKPSDAGHYRNKGPNELPPSPSNAASQGGLGQSIKPAAAPPPRDAGHYRTRGPDDLPENATPPNGITTYRTTGPNELPVKLRETQMKQNIGVDAQRFPSPYGPNGVAHYRTTGPNELPKLAGGMKENVVSHYRNKGPNQLP